MTDTSRYGQIIEHIFLSGHKEGATEVDFTRDEIESAAKALKIALPKNLGDVLYSFRYRRELPKSISDRAPEGKVWIIRPVGRAKYRFVAVSTAQVEPNELMSAIKVPDATPGLITRWALSDEQALLAKLRYNRLIDIFSGVTCYSLQNHLRTSVPAMGQVETDEVYIGVDRRGAQYVFPVQAKGGSDKLSIVQIEQDFAMCADKFPHLVCKPIAAQFVGDDLIALFDFEENPEQGVSIQSEKHYRLVPEGDLSDEEIRAYAEDLPPSK